MALSKPGVFPEQLLGKSQRVMSLTMSKSGSTRTCQKPAEHDSNLIECPNTLYTTASLPEPSREAGKPVRSQMPCQRNTGSALASSLNVLSLPTQKDAFSRQTVRAAELKVLVGSRRVS